jgi:hypothetical protein
MLLIDMVCHSKPVHAHRNAPRFNAGYAILHHAEVIQAN